MPDLLASLYNHNQLGMDFSAHTTDDAYCAIACGSSTEFAACNFAMYGWIHFSWVGYTLKGAQCP